MDSQMAYPTRAFTAQVLTAFIAICTGLGAGAYFWAQSLDLLSGLEVFVLHYSLLLVAFAFIPFTVLFAYAIYISHMQARAQNEPAMHDRVAEVRALRTAQELIERLEIAPGRAK